MDITISVSDRVVENIQERANGKPIDDFVEEFVEDSFSCAYVAENGKGGSHSLLAFAGMFSSGVTDTSERMSDIMKETNFDPAEGFSSGIPKK